MIRVICCATCLFVGITATIAENERGGNDNLDIVQLDLERPRSRGRGDHVKVKEDADESTAPALHLALMAGQGPKVVSFNVSQNASLLGGGSRDVQGYGGASYYYYDVPTAPIMLEVDIHGIGFAMLERNASMMLAVGRVIRHSIGSDMRVSPHRIEVAIGDHMISTVIVPVKFNTAAPDCLGPNIATQLQKLHCSARWSNIEVTVRELQCGADGKQDDFGDGDDDGDGDGYYYESSNADKFCAANFVCPGITSAGASTKAGKSAHVSCMGAGEKAKPKQIKCDKKGVWGDCPACKR